MKCDVVVPYVGYYVVTVDVDSKDTDEAFEKAVEALTNMTASQLNDCANEEEWHIKLITDYGSKNFSAPDEAEFNFYVEEE